MSEATIFTAGDKVRYHGDMRCGANYLIMAGYTATVYQGNEDHEDDVWIKAQDDEPPVPVGANELEWLAGA